MDLKSFVEAAGYLGIFLIVFAESGLFFGFFLPGDTLLFMAGFLASQNIFSLPILLIGIFVFAVLGDGVGYAFGKKWGRRLFDKKDSRFFKQKYLLETEEFYKKHGAKTIILARFMPIIRTFAPIVAGIALMQYSKFLRYNLIGGFLWAVGITLLGYFLGSLIPDIDKYLLPIVVLILVFSCLPGFLHYFRKK